ncbi:MAG: adenylate/guanylate cyclase domain-containing protein [Acidimicrobiia bacterium]
MATETLTFLFTDLEGSTRLWEEHPDAMRVALAHHDDLLRAAVEGNGGQVVKSTGDGTMATFRSAGEAIGAAVAGQEALCAATWPDPLELRVRMGLHAGEATARDGDWFGSDVNRAARVMAVAHGRQIVCTRPVADQVRDHVALDDLGEHRLRDLQAAVHLYQVGAPSLPTTFPPLRSLDAYRSNLPHELSTFVGRDEALRAAADRMRSSRVVTVVGVGGVGKTRLAVHVASELLPHYADGVWLCELAPVQEPGALADAIAAAFGYTPPQGTPVRDGLARFLERKDLLLVLDNCEHLVGAVAEWVTVTTAAAPKVSVLATSREALGVRGEHVAPLASLELASAADVTSVVTSEAGSLFLARAEEARGDLALDEAGAKAVHDICVRLDGIPLAIELAAARTALMSPAEILSRLDQQFRLLTGGRRTSLERHQTLRAAIDWSFELLSDDERALLARLSVCVGGFDLDAVVALAAGIEVEEFEAFDVLASLVAKSLVERAERYGTTRYRLLEMIRQYAVEKLVADTARAARDDHARHFLDLAHTLLAETATPADFDALERLETETPNIVAAARWLLDDARPGELLLFFADLPFLDAFAYPPALADDLGMLASEVIEESGSHRGFEVACDLAVRRAFFAGDLGEYRRVNTLARQAGDLDPAAATAIDAGVMALYDGDVGTAVTFGRAAVDRARRDRDPATLAWMLGQLSVFQYLADGDDDHALAQEALEVARATGSKIVAFYPLLAMQNATATADPSRSLAAAEESIRFDRTRRKTFLNLGRGRAAMLHLSRGDLAEGVSLCRECVNAYAHDGELSVFAIAVAGWAASVASSEPALAIKLAVFAESDAIAAFPAFTNQPQLNHFPKLYSAEIAAARAEVEGFGYDDAVEHLLTTFDRVIAEHAAPLIELDVEMNVGDE